jgi:hypothetical protein
MAGLQQTWVMAPGNHDAYFFGNDAAADRLTWRDWQRACVRGGSLMTKDRFVRSYLQVLFAQNDAGARQVHDRFGDLSLAKTPSAVPRQNPIRRFGPKSLAERTRRLSTP